MKIKITFIQISAFIMLLGISPVFAAAVIPFYDGFDGSSYTDNGAMVSETGSDIDHAYWTTNNLNSGATITSTAQYLSEGRSLAVVSSNPGNNQAQVLLNLGGKESGTAIPITEDYTIQFSFYLTKSDMKGTFFISGGGYSAYFKYGDGKVIAWENGVVNSTELYDGLVANQWYTLVVSMPGDFSINNTYGLGLYQAAGTNPLATKLGSWSDIAFYGATPVNSLYASLAYVLPSEAKNGILYVDNVTVIPEPGTMALFLLGGVWMAWCWRRQKSIR